VPDTRRFLALYVLVVLTAAGIYANTLPYGAAWDDSRFVFASGAPEGVRGIPAMFRNPLLRDMPAGRGAYRPMTGSSYALDWTLGRGQASFFHWTNVALHAAVTALVLLLLIRLGAPPAGAVAGGAFFAVHPVHVEAVANIAGRSELLVALFALAAIVTYLGGGSERSRTAAVGRGAAVLFFVSLGALSKEQGVMIPALLVLVEALRPGAGDRPLRRLLARWRLWLGCAVVVVGYMALRRAVLGTFTTWDVAPFITTLPASARVMTAVANWAQYARLHFFPMDLSVDYGPALVLPVGAGSPRFWLGALVGAASITVAAFAYRRYRLATLGLVWFALVLFPVSNLVVPIAQWLAERFFYLASVGFAMGIAAFAALVQDRANPGEARRAAALVGIVIVLFAARTWTRNRSWEDTDTVLATLVTEHPEAFRAQWVVGRMYFEQGRLDEAFAALDSATALNPNAISLPIERGEWLVRLGRGAEAEALMRSLPALMHADREAHLVRALILQGRLETADSAMAAAREAFPANARLKALADSLDGLEAEAGR
jgi:protein O-mannosyl-transferase